MHTFSGIVQQGNLRGRSLGFPTANTPAPSDIPDGIYVSVTYIDDTKHKSLTFIGKAETFDEADIVAETYILSFDRDLYGQEITVTLLEKLRDSQKFASRDELILAMEEDKKQAIEYFETMSKVSL